MQADYRRGVCPDEADPDRGQEECGPEGLLLEPALSSIGR
jgi:hypothetical protein